MLWCPLTDVFTPTVTEQQALCFYKETEKSAYGTKHYALQALDEDLFWRTAKNYRPLSGRP